MPITAQQAWDATDPSKPDEEREASATAIMAGVAANDAYLASRSELERLKVLSTGEQVPPSHASLNSEAETVPTGSGDQTAIEGTAVEEPAENPSVGSGEKADEPTLTDDTAEKLRAQLRAANLTPEA